MNYSIEELKNKYAKLNTNAYEEAIKEAITKLEAEKCENALALIKMILVLTLSEGDRQLADCIINAKYKSLAKCFNHIKMWAKERATADCAVIDHEEVLSEAIHYYVDMDDKEEKALKTTITIPKPAQSAPSLFESANTEEINTPGAQTPKATKAFALNTKPKEERAVKQSTSQNNLISLF